MAENDRPPRPRGLGLSNFQDIKSLLQQLEQRAAQEGQKGNASPDQKTRLEMDDLERTKKALDNQSQSQDIAERKRYAMCFFCLSCTWIVVIVVILLLQGFGAFRNGNYPFSLDKEIVLAAIGATTVNILGILYVVANYLFPKK